MQLLHQSQLNAQQVLHFIESKVLMSNAKKILYLLLNATSNVPDAKLEAQLNAFSKAIFKYAKKGIEMSNIRWRQSGNSHTLQSTISWFFHSTYASYQNSKSDQITIIWWHEWRTYVEVETDDLWLRLKDPDLFRFTVSELRLSWISSGWAT